MPQTSEIERKTAKVRGHRAKAHFGEPQTADVYTFFLSIVPTTPTCVSGSGKDAKIRILFLLSVKVHFWGMGTNNHIRNDFTDEWFESGGCTGGIGICRRDNNLTLRQARVQSRKERGVQRELLRFRIKVISVNRARDICPMWQRQHLVCL